MDIRWVEDFLCLAQLRSFSRAAQARYVTQSAFSRRIRSLENWFGAPLVDRSLYPVTLTDAGEDFLHTAADITRQIYSARANVALLRKKTERTVTFAATHSLSLDFFACWVGAIEKRIGDLDIRLITENYYDAVQSLRGKACDFLLCFTHPKLVTAPRDWFEYCVLGQEFLIPVSPPTGGARRARFRLPGSKEKPVPYLSYGPHTHLGKVVRSILDRHPCELKLRYENAFSESIKSMALSGRGVAWLPENIIREDIAAGRLCRIGDSRWRDQLDICLLRRREISSPLCDLLWKEAGRNRGGSLNLS